MMAYPFGTVLQMFVFQFVSDYFLHLSGKQSYDKATVDNFMIEFEEIITGPNDMVFMYNMSTPSVEHMIVE